MLRRGLAGGVQSGESSVAETLRPTSDEPPKRFDHYELLTGEDGKALELGRGSMGVTYNAFDINLRCAVALKVISARFVGDESARRRFVREARAAASVATRMLPRCFISGRAATAISMPWSLRKGKRSRT